MQTRHALHYANQVLKDLGVNLRVDEPADHPAIAWQRSGLGKVTPQILPLPLASHADGVLMALKSLISEPDRLPKYGSQLLGERAVLRQIQCTGQATASGFGRLLQTKDDQIALNLVRDDDWDLIAAWLENPAADWNAICDNVKTKSANYLTQRAAELGLAIAMDSLLDMPKTWFEFQKYKSGDIVDTPLIVDLSSLWAGPLASYLLQMAGARVIKIESPSRPDGARLGHAGFYDLLNGGKDCVAVNFNDGHDVKRLKTLLHRADIVIEASRPLAFEHLDIRAEDFVAAKAGKIWARLTAYGQGQRRIGFGDDIGVESGLTRIMDSACGQSYFVGDAIADPMNGLHLALAIYAFYSQGISGVLDISMCDVMRYAMGNIPKNLPLIAQQWQDMLDKDDRPFYPMRRAYGYAKPIGADNGIWLC